MASNRLQLNTTKTEVLWCSSGRRRHQLPSATFRVGSDYIEPAAVVRDLGIYIDSDVNMRCQVSHTVSRCFGVLRQLRTIRRSVTESVFQSLVVMLVLPVLDYRNATLAGALSHRLRRLQSLMNTAARLIFRASRCDHVTPLLRRLHWLHVPERVSFKLATLTFRCLHGLAPAYLSSDIHRVADAPSRRRLRSSSTAALAVPRTRCTRKQSFFRCCTTSLMLLHRRHFPRLNLN